MIWRVPNGGLIGSLLTDALGGGEEDDADRRLESDVFIRGLGVPRHYFQGPEHL